MTDELEQKAQQLFDAGRRERPDQAARERVLGLYAAASRQRQARARRWAVAACIAAACGVGLLVWRAGHAPTPFIRAEPQAAGDTAAHAVPALPPSASGAQPAPSSQPPPRPLRGVTPKSSAPAPPDLAGELALLDRARAALAAGDARGALAELDRHQRLPTRSMSAEATLLRIQALASIGSTAEASALARAFVENNPNSPLSDRARRFIDGPGFRPSPQEKP